jgi:hypothetical protein
MSCLILTTYSHAKKNRKMFSPTFWLDVKGMRHRHAREGDGIGQCLTSLFSQGSGGFGVSVAFGAVEQFLDLPGFVSGIHFGKRGGKRSRHARSREANFRRIEIAAAFSGDKDGFAE